MGEQRSLFDVAPPPAPAPRSRALPEDLRALTLWQPWAHAVAHMGKRVENRPWKPWSSIVGQLVAIHAAAKVDAAEEARVAVFIRERLGLEVPSAHLPRGCIIALARVEDFVTSSDDPWFFGPYGWRLADVEVLPQPVACRGMQGLWPVPRELHQVIDARRVPLTGVSRG